DSGINLSHPTFLNRENKIVRQAFRAGVTQMNLLSTDVPSSIRNLALAKRYSRSLFASVGIHPVEVSAASPDQLVQLSDLLDSRDPTLCLAVGEIGLDFSSHAKDKSQLKSPSQPPSQPTKSSSSSSTESSTASSSSTVSTSASDSTSDAPVTQAQKEKQETFLVAQLELASKHQLPVVLHVRDAHAETLRILREWRPRLVDVMIFCFSGNEQELADFLALDCGICITGLICNDARGAALKPLLRLIPRHRIFLATDAPYLTPYANLPKPYPKHNTPSLLPYVAQISELYHSEMSQTEFSKLVIDNSRAFFRISPSLFTGLKPVGAQLLVLPASSEPPASSSTLSSTLSSIVRETKKSHQHINLQDIDAAALPVLRPGQCYFAHQGKTFGVSLQIAALLKKQRELLGDTPAFDSLLTDLLSLESSKR
ncbi:MAG: TatD family hydrolase, partial [archaeon]|nr:TatD family hydrolase [archaeon]